MRIDSILAKGFNNDDDLAVIQASLISLDNIRGQAESLKRDFSSNLLSLPVDSTKQWSVIFMAVRELCFDTKKAEQSGSKMIAVRDSTDTFAAKEAARPVLPRNKAP